MSFLTHAAFFKLLADAVTAPTPQADRVTLLLKAEVSDFIRFNQGAVRQATEVHQAHATLAVVRGGRRIESVVSLQGQLEGDIARLLAERGELLAALPDLPDDPYLMLPEAVHDTHRHDHGSLPGVTELVRMVTDTSRGLDLVGFYAGGPVVRAFADSRGQRNWHHVESFHFDWCLYHATDKAVKTAYAGTHWDGDEFVRRMHDAAQRLPLLAKPPRVLQPGGYRAFFTPTAMVELLGTVGWSGFGAKAWRRPSPPRGM